MTSQILQIWQLPRRIIQTRISPKINKIFLSCLGDFVVTKTSIVISQQWWLLGLRPLLTRLAVYSFLQINIYYIVKHELLILQITHYWYKKTLYGTAPYYWNLDGTHYQFCGETAKWNNSECKINIETRYMYIYWFVVG